MSASTVLLDAVRRIDGLDRIAGVIGVSPKDPDPLRAAGTDFVLEGLCALRKISRTDEGRLLSLPRNDKKSKDPKPARTIESLMEEDDDETTVKGKKKYYN